MHVHWYQINMLAIPNQHEYIDDKYCETLCLTVSLFPG